MCDNLEQEWRRQLMTGVQMRSCPGGMRLVGFDKAHAIRESRGPGGTPRVPYDHRHRRDTVRPCRFKDAGTLIEDFWAEVDRFLKEKGVL